jgi:MFS transporter, CP family, cyanate transporter
MRTKATPALGVLLAAIVLLAINLRAGLAGVGPVVADIRAGTGLANVAIGLLTTLPLLAFGFLSAFTATVTRRVGVEGGVVLALVLIGAGILARSVPAVTLLFAGTIVLGVGIALGNVLLPALAKLYFPDRVGPVTSLYSSMMGLGATLAAGVTAPLALVLGWRIALGVWVVPAVVALVIWVPIARRRHRIPDAERKGSGLSVLGRSPLAWQIALFMGFQSLTFYVMLAWMPDLLASRGFGSASAGWLLALSQAAGVAGTAIVPVWAVRLADQRAIVWILGLLEAASLLGLFVAGNVLVVLWVAVLGFVLGGTFGLALLLLALRTPDAATAGVLSGMAQSIGYLIAAAGPTVFGLIHDVTGGWAVPLLFLGFVLLAKVVVGSGAGRAALVSPAS